MKIMQKVKFLTLTFVIAGILIIPACKKDNSGSGNNSSGVEAVANASADDATFQSAFNDVFENVTGIDNVTAGDDLGLYGNAGAGVFGTEANTGSTVELTEQPSDRCFTVTVEPMEKGVFPKTVTIDFGTGCEMGGRIRKGKIITVFTGRLYVPGSKATTTFDEYYVNEFKVEGTHIIENTAASGSNERSFTITVENAKITNTITGRWCTWSSTRNFTQTEGNGTQWWPLDDVFQITGNSQGACSDGKSWTAEIITPLVREFTCRWIVEGTVSVKVNDFEGTLDFGNGTCDNTATLTVNGNTRTITLH